ncbi:ATP-sensitive inward rectifier potassium channel 10-like [Clavelina lepadiformis]|uniref:ATP-sensitive inward rectifier potassium channel 10-like n=1 Tax=Clavelina lepadiformis TaxID=159417 RepID=UPI00404202D3
MEYESKLQSDDVCEHSDGISELKYIDSEDCERNTDCHPIADPNNNEEGQLKRKETNKDRLHHSGYGARHHHAIKMNEGISSNDLPSHSRSDTLTFENEHENSYSGSESDSDSSNDESLNDSSFEAQGSHNLNSNNNKKKKSRILEAKNGAKHRAVNFRLTNDRSFAKKHEDGSRSRQMSRLRSVQLSSIRALSSSNEKKGTNSWMDPHPKMEYGKRLIERDGNSNVSSSEISRCDLFSRYFSDIFTTMLDSSWSWVLFITIFVYVGHWIIFGVIYWLFAIANDDYYKILGYAEEHYEEHATNSTVEASHSSNDDPCVFNVHDGWSAFLFSLESETTIGYGYRTISTACPHAVVCLTLQCIISAIFDTWVIGMCYGKLARPDARTRTTLFSKKAVICKRDGKRYLLIRFANLRKSLLLNVSVRARLITIRAAHNREKNVGYQGMLEQRQIAFENSSSALLTAPIEYKHVIDNDSPLYNIKPCMYNNADRKNYFEIVFIVTGTLESTGLTMQSQTSYLSSEIMCGHRFVPIITKCPEKKKYVVDFSKFHDVVKESAPLRKVGKYQPRWHSRSDSTVPLVEESRNETEDDVFSTSDEVFADDNCLAQSAQPLPLSEENAI